MSAVADLDKIIDQSPRVRTLKKALKTAADLAGPAMDLYRPYVDGLDNLPRDGRFLLVGNHTQTANAEVMLSSYFVYRHLGRRVRPLAERGMGRARGVVGDLMAAYGGVVGSPASAQELMRHNETILVFPGGGREIGKFKGEEYQLKWQRRAGFAREAIAGGYPIVPMGLVGGDDIYRSIVTRDSLLGRLNRTVSEKLSGKQDMVMTPLVLGWGPTLIPSPQRMYLRFGDPVDTTKPTGVSDDEWISSVKKATQTALEGILADLLKIRESDPYRHLNPLARHRAVQPAAVSDTNDV
ncbi:lysophospholipid acyltransferase family protein [Mycolicibacterium sp. CBM1]